MRLYVIRHADPDYPNNTITPAGHLEAAALGRRMAKIRPTHVYTSPLGRARDTAGYTCELINKDPIVEKWTAELSDYHIEDEPWGKTVRPGTGPAKKSAAASTCPITTTGIAWIVLPILFCASGSKSFDPTPMRFSHATVTCAKAGDTALSDPNRDRIAVFCHGGFGLCWLAHLLEIPLPLMWSGFFLSPSSVTTVLFDERSTDWAVPRCLGVADVSHLYAEGLPVQPSGIQANFE